MQEIRKSYNAKVAGVVNDGLIYFQKLRQVITPFILVIICDVISYLVEIFTKDKVKYIFCAIELYLT